jgi:hypothetical protein
MTKKQKDGLAIACCVGFAFLYYLPQTQGLFKILDLEYRRSLMEAVALMVY